MVCCRGGAAAAMGNVEGREGAHAPLSRPLSPGSRRQLRAGRGVWEAWELRDGWGGGVYRAWEGGEGEEGVGVGQLW